MKTRKMVKKAKELNERTKLRKADPRYRKVLGFLKAKGLLFDETVRPRPNIKLDVIDVLWVAENLEPRVLEVFPAALIHFNKTFFNTQVLPDALNKIIESIRKRSDLDTIYKGIEFKKMKEWANHPLKDKRVKPIRDHKITKTYRLKPKALEALKLKAKAVDLNETEFLERIILQN